MQADYFIEVFKGKGWDKLMQSPEPMKIEFLEWALKNTEQASNLKTIAVWKIKLKK